MATQEPNQVLDLQGNEGDEVAKSVAFAVPTTSLGSQAERRGASGQESLERGDGLRLQNGDGTPEEFLLASGQLVRFLSVLTPPSHPVVVRRIGVNYYSENAKNGVDESTAWWTSAKGRSP